MARAELAAARREVAAGRFAPAAARLERIRGRWTGDGEVDSLLGRCALARRDPEAALEAWGRVPPDSPFGVRAALDLEQVALSLGRFSEVERALVAADRAAPPGTRAELRSRLGRLLRFEGRIDEVAALLEAEDDGPIPASRIVERAMLDLEPLPVEVVRQVVDRAASAAPEDARVLLAKANLEIRLGHLEAAGRWLDEAQRRVPAGDLPTRTSRLNWAMASDDVGAVHAAAAAIDAAAVPDRTRLGLRSWLAARANRTDLEILALEEWLAIDPGSAESLERMATLAIHGGEPDRAATFRRRKDEIDRARRLYRSILAGDSLEGRAAELARLAATLGRPFEARGWQAIASRSDPAGAETDSAVVANGASGPRPAGTLADSLGDLFRLVPRTPPRVARLDGATPSFSDVAERSELRFVQRSGRSTLKQLPETMSGGLGLLDFDRDGWLDVYCVQGGPFPPPVGAGFGDRLFRNRRDGTFEDVTSKSGLARTRGGYGHGVAVGDYDNDGFPDIFVTRFGSYALYRNRRDGTFEDATEAAGLGGDRDWPTSAAMADFDHDGDLDLYVCHYLRWDPSDPKLCRDPQSGAYLYCTPHILDARPDHLFRNDGGRFVDASESAGIVDLEGPGLGVVAADFDEDGLVDLFVANDGTANYLFHNRGGFRFEEVGVASGVACNAQGGFQAGMGVACGDLDGDGRLDLVVTNYYNESSTFFRNLGGGHFSDHTSAIGLGMASRHLLGFGVAMLDANDDGLLDLVTAAGHVNDLRPRYPHAMPAQLLIGSDSGRLVDVSDSVGPAFLTPRLGRALAQGDLDRDGRTDLLLLAQDEPLVVLKNESRGGHSLTIELSGRTSNRDAVGAIVTATAGGRKIAAQRTGGGSYQSSSDPRIHLGLGEHTQAELVEVRWPSGLIQAYRNLRADRLHVLVEGPPDPKE